MTPLALLDIREQVDKIAIPASITNLRTQNRTNMQPYNTKIVYNKGMVFLPVYVEVDFVSEGRLFC